MAKKESVIPVERIEQLILSIRGEKVILDADLAVLYGVTTKRLNEQVKRNRERFPKDFMFQLNADEKAEVLAKGDHLTNAELTNLKSHFATSSSGWGGRRSLPYAFTEHGAIMAASVLNTKQAVKVSVFVVRAFVKLKSILASHKELSHELAEVERRLGKHDKQIYILAEAIRQLMEKPTHLPSEHRQIGFPTGERSDSQ